MNISIYLHRDRSIPGILELREGVGVALLPPLVSTCLGQSDKATAEKNGNPGRDPIKPYGHIPTGQYTGKVTVAGASLRSYGPHKRILLTPVDGECAKATERWGLMIHGGEPKPNGDFRPTHGCVRVSNETMAELVSLVGDQIADVRVVEVG